jgi:GTP cyclohydrolase IA
MRTLSWPEIYARLQEAPPGRLWGIPRGGQIVAGLTGRAVDTPDEAEVIVDDVWDSGATRDRYQALYAKPFWALITKQPGEGWVRFPWEAPDATADLADTVRRQLAWIGEDPTREGLRDTPQRVLKALEELTTGYRQDPAQVLQVTFQADCDQMVVVRDIPYYSLCEHHMLPFHGQVTLGYVPRDGRVVGLSKLPRLVHCFARRLQVQERLTTQIADALQTIVRPAGVGVAVTGAHTCMQMRGIRSSGVMLTSALRGVFLEKPEARAEFLQLARIQ